MSGSSWRGLSVLMAGVALTSCGEKGPPAEPVAIPTVMVMANDYAFQMPDTLSSGVTTFRLMNHGQELHHMVLIRFAEGQTMADLQKMGEAQPPAGMVLMGGPNFATPGGAIEATVNLEPGQYAAVCLVPSPDGQVHMAKGMMKSFTVVAAPATQVASAPAPDVTVTMSDYKFEPSRPLGPGRQVIRIENTATQWHEMVFVKLEAGKKVEDLLKWLEKPEGPPPASPVAGTSPMSPGETVWVTVDLTAGDYAFICFLPDAKDQKPHFIHGMMQPLRVD